MTRGDGKEGSRALLASVRERLPTVLLEAESLLWSAYLAPLLRAREVAHDMQDWTPVAHQRIEEFLGECAAGPRRLSCVPLIDKSDLRHRLASFLRPDASPYQRFWAKATSGTTGSPVQIPFAADFYFDHLLLTLPRIARRAGLSVPGHHASVAVALTDYPACADELWFDCAGGRLVLQLVVSPDDAGMLEHLGETLRGLGPYAVSVKPSLLEWMCDEAAAIGQLDGTCAALACSGSDLDPALRSRSEAIFRVPIIEAYGLTEFGIVASECSARAGLHVDGDVLVEIVDGTGEPVPDGVVGDVVLSSVRNAVLPLVRYRTGDTSAIDGRRCECGRLTPRLVRIGGRSMPNFRLASGRTMSPVRFQDIFREFPVAEFQLTQTARDAFRLVIEPQPRRRVDATALAEWVTRKVGEPVQVGVQIAPLMGRTGKFERFRVET